MYGAAAVTTRPAPPGSAWQSDMTEQPLNHNSPRSATGRRRAEGDASHAPGQVGSGRGADAVVLYTVAEFASACDAALCVLARPHCRPHPLGLARLVCHARTRRAPSCPSAAARRSRQCWVEASSSSRAACCRPAWHPTLARWALALEVCWCGVGKLHGHRLCRPTCWRSHPGTAACVHHPALITRPARQPHAG